MLNARDLVARCAVILREFRPIVPLTRTGPRRYSAPGSDEGDHNKLAGQLGL
jgi:hypothetical protein